MRPAIIRAFLLIITVLWLPFGAQAKVPGDQSPLFNAAIRAWLLGADDLAALTRDDNIAAQITLGLIERQPQNYGHIYKTLPTPISGGFSARTTTVSEIAGLRSPLKSIRWPLRANWLHRPAPKGPAYPLGLLFHLRDSTQFQMDMLSPFLPIISTEDWQRSGRFRADYLRLWSGASPRSNILQDLSPCLAQAINAAP